MRRRELLDEMGIAVVDDGMDRIEAQPVEAVFLQPVEGVVDEEVAHDAAASPSTLMPAPHGVGWRSVKKDLA